MAWLFRTWTLMFWLPVVASAATGWLALGHGILLRPVPVVMWCLTAIVIQLASELFSAVWILGLAAQSALAIYLIIRLKLHRGGNPEARHHGRASRRGSRPARSLIDGARGERPW